METNCNKCWVKIIVKNNIYSCKTCYREYQKQYRNKQDKEKVKDYMRGYMKRYRSEKSWINILNNLNEKRWRLVEIVE